jgi:hypothetical protein
VRCRRHPSDLTAHLARVTHDVGAAGLLGGSLFGRFALHPSVTAVRNPAERGKVVNAAWRRYGAVNGLSLAAVTAGWIAARATDARPSVLSERERRLAWIKDALLAGVAASGVATAVTGVRFSRLEPGGAVPLASGDRPAPEATREEARLKRRLNWLGAVTTGAELGYVAANAALAQAGHSRPPLRRALTRRSR